MNNAKLQLEVASPTSIRCGHIEWFALDTKLVGKVKALLEKNEHLKYHLNDIVFDDNNIDVELGARLLRKLGYCDFDEERKVYLNKHNNQPLMQEDEKEKSYYLKDDELDDYTKQLEYKIDKAIEYITHEWFKREQIGISHLSFSYDELQHILDILRGENNE